MKTNPFRTERVRSDLNIRREYREGSIEEEHCKISSSQWMMVEPWKGKVRFYANRHLACGENRNVSIPTCLTSCRRKIDIVLPLVCRGKRATFLNAYDRLVSRVEGRKVARLRFEYRRKYRFFFFFFSSRAAISSSMISTLRAFTIKWLESFFSGGARPSLPHHHRQRSGNMFARPRRGHSAEREDS